MSAATLTIRIAASITDFSKGLDAAEKRLLKAGDNLERMGERLSLKVTAPLLALGGLLAKSAAEDAASVEKMGRVFGKAQGDMESFVQSLMKSVPATDDALRGMVSSTGTLLTQMGLAPAKATAMTQAVTKLAGDMAAFNHVSQEVAQDALEKALLGKTKGLSQFGIAVNEADIKAKAYAMGLAKVGAELTHTQTAQAALAAVLERSRKIQGEAARTIGDDANAWARMKQATDGVADSFGAVVLPTFVRVANAATTMANSLAAIPEGAKGAIVIAGSLAAAWGPLVYLGGNVVKILTLMRAGFVALVSVQALSGLGSMVIGVRSLSAALAAAQLAGAALLTALGPLLIAGAAVAAVGGIAYLFYKSGEAARKAKTDVDAFKASLAMVTDVGSARAMAKGIAAKIEDTRNRGAGLTDVQQQAFNQQLIAANARVRMLSGDDGAVKPIPGGAGAGDGKNPFADLEEKAGRLGRVYALTNAKGHPLVGLNQQITGTIDALSAALARQTDKWGDVALRIREALESLERFGEATFLVAYKGLPALTKSQLTAKTTNTRPNGIPGVNAPLANITSANIPVHAPPEMLKQVSLQERMVEQLALLPGQFASQLGSYLGPVLARIGGGKGGAIGAALGGGIGGAIGTALVPQGMGKIAGAVVGSVVPIVGTIIGSLVGAGIGGAIGKLFGGGKKKADEAADAMGRLAEQARKVSEAISGLPQGIKIAAYRFAATGAVPPTTGSNGGGGGPGDGNTSSDAGDGSSQSRISITGPITINGVTDVPAFFRALSAYAEQSAGRGGITGLQLAATR